MCHHHGGGCQDAASREDLSSALLILTCTLRICEQLSQPVHMTWQDGQVAVEEGASRSGHAEIKIIIMPP